MSGKVFLGNSNYRRTENNSAHQNLGGGGQGWRGASAYKLQHADMASCKTDSLCTLRGAWNKAPNKVFHTLSCKKRVNLSLHPKLYGA